MIDILENDLIHEAICIMQKTTIAQLSPYVFLVSLHHTHNSFNIKN